MAGAITALKVQKNNPERVSVFIDGAFAFGVTLDVAARLRKGQPLSDAEIAELRTNDEVDKAYQAALHFLAARPRSRSEVVRRLTEKGHAAEAIDAALERLDARSYVDDAAFAAFWVENRSRFRPRSAAAIAYELRQKGVEGEAIRAALNEIDEERAAWAAIERQLGRWRALTKAEFEQKIIAHLARRGFGFEIARKVAQHAWEEQQSPDEP
ncbi:MAG: regulatory protein RecX [Chloroflexota bacterium]|nr:RecX family transcriptional regulator [Caldilinea sp.]GIK73454.1 MAG: regulatory protein RecX [Chloroflexota bacterium]